MNGRGLDTMNVAAGVLLIGGIVVFAWPQHALSTLQVVIVSIAAGACVYALAVHVPPTGWISPFKWMSPFNTHVAQPTGRGADEEAWIRSRLSGRRQRMEGGLAWPPDTLRLLKPLIEAALGTDATPGASTAARDRLSPLTRAVLEADPLERAHWFDTERADPHAVAELVDRVLDDIQRLGALDPAPLEIEDTSWRRAT